MDTAMACVRGTMYGSEQAYGLSPVSETRDGYAFSCIFPRPDLPKVCGLAVDCSSSFQPPRAAAEAVIREVSVRLIAFARACRRGVDGAPVTLRTPTFVFHAVRQG